LEPEDPDWDPEFRIKRESNADDDEDAHLEDDFRFDDEDESLAATKEKKKKRRKDSVSSQDKTKGAPTGNSYFFKHQNNT
jgi:hypothetical protein